MCSDVSVRDQKAGIHGGKTYVRKPSDVQSINVKAARHIKIRLAWWENSHANVYTKNNSLCGRQKPGSHKHN